MARARSAAAGLAGGLLIAAGALILSPPAPTIAAQAQPTLAPPRGDAARGKILYDTTLRCYACHGFDGQTGSPRLVPATRPEDAFLAYLRKPATQGMPSFAAVPEPDLRDVYAYVRSLPPAAPAVESLPLLQGILDRRTKVD